MTPSLPDLPLNAILLLGPTGVGKSPLGDAIERTGFLGRRAHHLDFGAELRTIAAGTSPGNEYSREELDFISGVLERGLLLENEHFALAEKIITLYLKRQGFSSGHLLVLNGIPRHTGQARDISRLVQIRAIVMLECPADDVYCRIRENTGGDRTNRTDDERRQVENKLRIFQERTAPLLHHYEQAGCSVYRLAITSSTTPDEAARELSALSAAHPPIALVAEPPH